MRRYVFLSLVATFLIAGCSSSEGDLSPSDGSPDGGTAPESAVPTVVTETDLGKSCGGGCGGSKICTVESDTCESGHCLFDGRAEPSEAYCTADCSTAACPKNYACVDVPFSLKRACVHDYAPPDDDDTSPRARGTIQVTGMVAANGSPAQPFEIDDTFDTTPVAKLSSLKCGNVLLDAKGTTALQSPPSEAVFVVYLKGCGAGQKEASLNFWLPLKVGSFTGDSVVVPEANVQLTSGETSVPVNYGWQTNEGVLTVSVVDGASDKTKSPYRAKRVVAHLEGDLPKYSPCPDTSCATTAHLAVDIELLNVVTTDSP